MAKQYLGSDRILLIKYNGEFIPVGCLTSNGFSETTEFIPTKVRGVDGTWNTQRPVSQSASISFSGVQKNTTQIGAELNLISYDRLKRMKRAFELIEWEIRTRDFILQDSGKGHISDISESASVGDYLTFEGSITVFGAPVITDAPLNVIYYGASASIPTTLAGLQALTAIPFANTFTMNTGTTERRFIIGVQTGATIQSVIDTSVTLGADITSQFTLRSTVSGYDIYAMQNVLPYSTNHVLQITIT